MKKTDVIKDGRETMNVPRYSIIVPVYNAEKSIKRCLESILSQTYTNYEVIVIDDVSSDSSVQIIDTYCSKDTRLHLVRQEKNLGPSAARNLGLSVAKGEIITFVDADDYVLPIYLEKIQMTFETFDADVVYFEYLRKDELNNVQEKHILPSLSSERKEVILSLTKADMFGYTWLKAIKKNIISGCKFEEKLKLFEDEVFTCSIMKKDPKIAFCYQPLYVYVRSSFPSLSLRVHPEYPDCCNQVFKSWKELLGGNVDSILTEKANHMLENCRWYGLERKVNPISFWKKVSESEFICKVTINDKFVKALKDKRLTYLFFYWAKYKIKVYLSNTIKKEEIVKVYE